jgi:hypothetical protein
MQCFSPGWGLGCSSERGAGSERPGCRPGLWWFGGPAFGSPNRRQKKFPGNKSQETWGKGSTTSLRNTGDVESCEHAFSDEEPTESSGSRSSGLLLGRSHPRVARPVVCAVVPADGSLGLLAPPKTTVSYEQWIFHSPLWSESPYMV